MPIYVLVLLLLLLLLLLLAAVGIDNEVPVRVLYRYHTNNTFESVLVFHVQATFVSDVHGMLSVGQNHLEITPIKKRYGPTCCDPLLASRGVSHRPDCTSILTRNT